MHLFALLTGLATLCLIGLGGLVTSHGVGMAVPDWPNTYGYNMFLFPVSKWVGGVLYEHTHRLVASAVGLLTTALAAWLWARETRGRTRWLGVVSLITVVVLLGIRHMPVYLGLAASGLVMIVIALVRAAKSGWSLRWLGMAAFSAVVVQGVLGGLRVVWAQDEIGVFHAALAQLFLALLAIICLLTSRWWSEQSASGSAATDGVARVNPARANVLLLATTSLIFLQLLIGATMRHQHAGLAIPDFPLAYGSVWPDISPEAVARYNQQRIETVAQNPITTVQIILQMAHRITAAAIVVMVIWCFVKVRKVAPQGSEMRRLASFWVLLICIQFGLGAWTIWSNKAADVASVHVICGALSLVTGGLLCVISARLRVGAASRMANRQADLSSPLMGNAVGTAVK